MNQHLFRIISQYIMKTAESFFPTKAYINIQHAHRDRPYQLIRKPNQEDQDNVEINSPRLWASSQNIFKNAHPSQKVVARPVGGVQLFKRLQANKFEKHSQNRKLSKRSNKEVTQSHINNNSIFTRFRKEKGENQQRQNQQNSPIKMQHGNLPSTFANQKEQNYKSHISYCPEKSTLKQTAGQQTGKSQIKSEKVRPSTSKVYNSKILQHQSWAKEQREEYHDKIALLKQISYNKPLVQVYGERYFEYILRNRFQQDLKPPAYIYQIGQKKFSSGKAISKIKYYRPDLKEKQAMIIKGRKLKKEHIEI